MYTFNTVTFVITQVSAINRMKRENILDLTMSFMLEGMQEK